MRMHEMEKISNEKYSDEILRLQFEDAQNRQEWRKEEIVKLRADILALQMPGELHVRSRSYNSSAYIEDERHGRYERNFERTNRYLVVGAQKQEHAYGLSDGYSGGKEFLVAQYESGRFASHKPPEEKSPEEYRQELLENRWKKLKDYVEEPWVSREEIPEAEHAEYHARREKFIQTLVEKWKQDDQEVLFKNVGNHEAYQSQSDALRTARALALKAQEDARRFRLYVVLPPIGEIGNESLGVLQRHEQALRKFAVDVQQQIAARLVERNEIEFSSIEERDRAMAADPIPAPWFLQGFSEKDLEKYGRKPGEGFGKRVRGKKGEVTFLPGEKSIVGLRLNGGSSRNGKQIFYSGLISLQYGDTTSLPAYGERGGTKILALVQNPEWCVRWIDTYDGVPQKYGLANASGIGVLYGGELYKEKDQEQVIVQHWDGTAGAGPSGEDIRRAHGLPAYAPHGNATQVASTATQDGILEPALGSGAFAMLFNQRNVEKSAEIPVVQKSIGGAQEKQPDQQLTNKEKAEALHEIQGDLLYIHGIFRGIPAKPYQVPRTKSEGELLAKAAGIVKEKRAEIFINMTDLKGITEAEVMQTTKDRERVFGKIAALKKNAERLAASKESNTLSGAGTANDWVGTFTDLWKRIPTTVTAEVNGMVTQESIPKIIHEIQERVSMKGVDVQQGKEINLKELIEEVAVEYMG